MKHQAWQHPKLTRLSGHLEIPRYAAAGLVEGLVSFACHFAEDGGVGKYENSELAKWLGWQGAPDDLVDSLVKSGWLDSVEGDQRLVIHDWSDHMPDFIRKRLARASQKKDAKSQSDRRRQPSSAVVRTTADNGCLPNQSKPNETPPFPPRPQKDEEGGLELESWVSVEDRLGRCGVTLASNAVITAKGNGVDPLAVSALIDHFEGHPGAWKAGALYSQVCKAIPGSSPEQHWPAPAKAYSSQQNSERLYDEMESRRARVSEFHAERQADQVKMEELESRYGEQFDNLTDEECLAMIGDNSTLQRRFSKEGRNLPTIRRHLLEAIASGDPPTPLANSVEVDHDCARKGA